MFKFTYEHFLHMFFLLYVNWWGVMFKVITDLDAALYLYDDQYTISSSITNKYVISPLFVLFPQA